jgi:hypothetical protein
MEVSSPGCFANISFGGCGDPKQCAPQVCSCMDEILTLVFCLEIVFRSGGGQQQSQTSSSGCVGLTLRADCVQHVQD